MVRPFYRTLLAVVLCGAGTACQAESASDAGAWIATHSVSPERAACAACHMSNGAGQPDVGIPRLAGQSSSYIESQLNYFASGARSNAVMSSYASALSPAQRQQVAEYFAGLKTPRAPAPFQKAENKIELGKAVFLNGNDRAGLVSCSQCHGATGLGVEDFSPGLAGQSAPYVETQLEAWHGGSLRDPKGEYMKSVAAHLTPAAIEAVAAYISTLDPIKGQRP